ncbi:hypothetical protein [Chitinilyticum aquatile]|uniref:hypothetical protein n=1 Tax=Chitinilyticum aquatile TaxID=362520 RepID=UPI000404A0E9|nr:hypothetical protein [Chitinilyticum aquatile]
MKRVLCIATLFALSNLAFAAQSAGEMCASQAAEKKLAGAAKNSFVKKCEKDAAAAATQSCEGAAKEKKLSGAAKNSFVTKCVKDGGPAK